MEFSRQEYWRGLPFPTPGNLPKPGIKPVSPTSPVLQADYLPLGKPDEYLLSTYFMLGTMLDAGERIAIRADTVLIPEELSDTLIDKFWK